VTIGGSKEMTLKEKLILAQNSVSAEELENLSHDENFEVRAYVAQNTNTSSTVLEKLSEDDDWEVRGHVAQNSNTPDFVLEKLSEDENEGVRWSTAKNPNTPDYVLERLATDEDSGIRSTARNNPSYHSKVANIHRIKNAEELKELVSAIMFSDLMEGDFDQTHPEEYRQISQHLGEIILILERIKE